ncbi:hypothetical protein J40TS1_37270 [Paenibacillus montaniterrae]|uniref:Uncharacterized protein n=1 Tax=Paenibacillus montaniterrae TaxID=429341 RepID=A0A919YRH9_9BACL|nr:hypothetical protein J40TS1_37270 [Paenibacillus montaniterrae]
MLNLEKVETIVFHELNDYVLSVKRLIAATAAATCIIHKGAPFIDRIRR